MAFNNACSIVYLAEGAEAWWHYSWGGGDQGTQMATADIKTPNGDNRGPAVHLADQQRKKKDNAGNATYFVHITNQGPGVAFHNLQGGGMS